MAKIVLISCVSTKLPSKSKAAYLYISPLFKGNLNYAKSMNPDKIFILSAKYGLLDLEEEIEPYNETLNEKTKEGIKSWASKVLEQLKARSDLENDEFIFLAGNNYRKFLIPHIKNYEIPLEGLGIGKQLSFLKGATKKNLCEELHQLLNSLPRFSFPFDDSKIPKNGIYILFESMEKGHKGDRIVRVGTHTGQDNLGTRLKEHFIKENKDRSIFRKNIGRSILNKEKDPFIAQWELTPLIREVREKHPEIDFEKQDNIEKEVSKIIRDNFSFCIIPIENKEKRLSMESKIISTISKCGECGASENWLGRFSPKEKIKESGLWLVNELYKNPLSEEDLKELKNILNQ